MTSPIATISKLESELAFARAERDEMLTELKTRTRLLVAAKAFLNCSELGKHVALRGTSEYVELFNAANGYPAEPELPPAKTATHDWTDIEMELSAAGREDLAEWVRDEVERLNNNPATN